jgi:signal transduction histidine kinase
VNVSELLATIVSDVDIEADAQGCAVDLQSEPGLFVEGDWELLRSALENVIRNAVRYSPSGARVTVGARLSRGQLEVVVRDGGPGVPEKDLALIFEPFYRVDAARNRAVGGDGLGLAIASRAIALHGGTIQASNVSPGGLAVHMLLPGMHGAVASQPSADGDPAGTEPGLRTAEQTTAQEKAALASGSPTVL